MSNNNDIAKKEEEELRPLYARVLVKRNEAEVKTKGGIFLAEASQYLVSQGVIVSMGDQVDDYFHVGQEVIWGDYNGGIIRHGGEDYVILQDEDILCIVENSKKGKGASNE